MSSAAPGVVQPAGGGVSSCGQEALLCAPSPINAPRAKDARDGGELSPRDGPALSRQARLRWFQYIDRRMQVRFRPRRHARRPLSPPSSSARSLLNVPAHFSSLPRGAIARRQGQRQAHTHTRTLAAAHPPRQPTPRARPPLPARLSLRGNLKGLPAPSIWPRNLYLFPAALRVTIPPHRAHSSVRHVSLSHPRLPPAPPRPPRRAPHHTAAAPSN